LSTQSKVNFTSSALNRSPLWNFTPLRNLNSPGGIVDGTPLGRQGGFILQLWAFVQEPVVHIDIHQDIDTLEVQKRVHIVHITLEGQHDPIPIDGPSLGTWQAHKRQHHKSDSSKNAGEAGSVQSSHDALLSRRSRSNPRLSSRSLISLSNSGPHYNGFTPKAQRPSMPRGCAYPRSDAYEPIPSPRGGFAQKVDFGLIL